MPPRADACPQPLLHCLFLTRHTILPLLSHLCQPHLPKRTILFKKLLNLPRRKAGVTPPHTRELQRHLHTAIQKVPQKELHQPTVVNPTSRKPHTERRNITHHLSQQIGITGVQIPVRKSPQRKPGVNQKEAEGEATLCHGGTMMRNATGHTGRKALRHRVQKVQTPPVKRKEVMKEDKILLSFPQQTLNFAQFMLVKSLPAGLRGVSNASGALMERIRRRCVPSTTVSVRVTVQKREWEVDHPKVSLGRRRDHIQPSSTEGQRGAVHQRGAERGQNTAPKTRITEIPAGRKDKTAHRMS